MYQINRDKNDIVKLEERLFGDLGFREREHLQEWIAKNPDCLGEDLLIIQKEYNGFNDTNERLDLLALDKDGGLVIIENKLDDTGRDVVWQALKYASYCSTLTTNQIIKIFQEYLDRYSTGEDAKETLLDFLEIEESDFLLNKNDQRVLFVANKYRKEVTSTVLWLLKHDIQVQCFRATPYSMEEELFLQIEQIIPLPETEEFMIDAREKEVEVNKKSKIVAEKEAKLINYWSSFKDDLKAHNIHFLDNVSAKPYYDIGFSKGSAYFGFCYGRKALRVDIYISNDQKKSYFDAMYENKDEIESKFNGELIWQRLDNKKASRIKFEIPHKELIFGDEKWYEGENKQRTINWYRENMVRFFDTVNPFWEKVK